MTKPRLIAAISAFLVLSAAIVVVGMVYWHNPVIPRDISRQVSFVIFYPQGSPEVELDVPSFKYDSKLKQLSYVVEFAGRKVTIAQQNTPDQFNDIPEYYPKLVEKMNGYASFENTIGKVNLTRPTETKNQVAAMNSKGTLLFAQSDGDISNEDWKRLFNSLTFVQPR